MFFKEHEYEDERGYEIHLGRGVIAGVVGGAIGTLVMTAFQEAMMQVMPSHEDQGGDQSDEQQSAQAPPQGDPTTVVVAEKMTWRALGRRLAPHEKPAAGQAVHYGFGMLMGGLYGALAEVLPLVTTGKGMPAGAALFFVADDMVIPALGLSAPPTEQPPSTHVYALAAHLVYGAACDAARSVARGLLG